MEDETTYQEVPQVTQDVADGQSVVDAIAADNAAVADDVVARVGTMLQSQQESSSSYVAIEEGQWNTVLKQMQYENTWGIMCCICMMAVFGAVVAQSLLAGWRRG